MTSIPTINLMPRDALIARERRRWVRRWAIAVGGCVALLGLGAVYSVFPGIVGEDTIELRMQNVRGQIRELEQELPGANQELEDATRRLRAAERVVVRPDWGALLAYLDAMRGDDVVLERVAITLGGDGGVVLSITGLSGQQGREGALVLGLERSGLFEQTTLVKTQRVNVQGGERISFEVRGVFVSGDEVAGAPTP